MIQGENSGPHQDTIFYKYLVNFCKAKKMAVGTSGTSYSTYECTGS